MRRWRWILAAIGLGATLLGACWVTGAEVRAKIEEGTVDSALDTGNGEE